MFLQENNIGWARWIGISTDGAAAMSGKHKGLVTRTQQMKPSVMRTHCGIHREALACKDMPPALKDVLTVAVKIANFIKARPLNSRLLAALCDEMGSERKHLVLHSKVCWLSRGKALSRAFELRDEVDISATLNQGKAVTIFNVHDKNEAMIKKLGVWSCRMESKVLDSFPQLSSFVESSEEELPEKPRRAIPERLQTLGARIRQYFPRLDTSTSWIMNPFQASLDTDLPLLKGDALIELSCKTCLRQVFSQCPLEISGCGYVQNTLNCLRRRSGSCCHLRRSFCAKRNSLH
ncbi:unnamed protein product [Ixodes hexagonus]